jgi:hypothetical protein
MLFEQSGMDRNASQVWMPNINVAHAIYARAALLKQHDGFVQIFINLCIRFS